MMREQKKYKITIFDQVYTIVSDESENHVMQSASTVDAQMREIFDKARTLEHEKIAVLTALKLASRLLETERKIKSVQECEKDIIELIDREL